MSSMAVARPVTMLPETGPGQLPARARPAPAEPPAPARSDRLRPLEVAQCSMCGIARPLGLLVPDGGQACADIHWYCKDARSCTERWTAARPPRPMPAVPGTAVAGAGEPAPDAAPAEPLDGMLEEAHPAR
jgi:hypothetical protein